MSEKLHNIISKVFSIPISEINDESGPETIESWDSFNGLILVDELESNFNIKFSVSEIIDVNLNLVTFFSYSKSCSFYL